MSGPDTIAGFKVVGYGRGYPIVECSEGLCYYDYTRNGKSYGWKVGTPDPHRHDHGNHLRASGGGRHTAHPHHAGHRTLHASGGQANHRRATVAPPDHASARGGSEAATQGGMQAGRGNSVSADAGKESIEPKEKPGWAERFEAFEGRHLRLILGLQGGMDMVVGVATVATAVVIIMALAPEVAAVGLILAVGGLVYGVTRGGVQAATGLAETITAIGGNPEAEKSMKEGAEQVKTLTSISGFLMLSTQQVRHGKMSKKDWEYAGYASDGETFVTGRGTDNAFDEARKTVKLSSRVLKALEMAHRVDNTDQYHARFKDGLHGVDAVQRLIEQQNADRERKSRGLPPVGPGQTAPPGQGKAGK